MSPYQLFRLARLILLMLLGTVFLSLARGRPVSRRLRLLVLALLAVAALGYVNFGFFHPGRGHVHYWDAFHYFMGAKYLPELGYSKLYEATYAAGRELGAFDYITQLRDLETYALREAATVDQSAVRSGNVFATEVRVAKRWSISSSVLAAVTWTRNPTSSLGTNGYAAIVT